MSCWCWMVLHMELESCPGWFLARELPPKISAADAKAFSASKPRSEYGWSGITNQLESSPSIISSCATVLQLIRCRDIHNTYIYIYIFFFGLAGFTLMICRCRKNTTETIHHPWVRFGTWALYGARLNRMFVPASLHCSEHWIQLWIVGRLPFFSEDNV